ncbi:hypothetical protein [Allostreptomyces psammosilenae]|uniref:Uncharacterized protein n=1 Tax=Allostreptomyces psammosilenae TaxID=1892865 RepID=A0A853A965_9ACTN|nr:hypothetical protein [Allostreptomyces psammosilenae]NYI07171.1 hypothetical protein [Allostreptomyces psammosilenae]
MTGPPQAQPPAPRPPDHEVWRTARPTRWRELGLHWHAYSWRGDGMELVIAEDSRRMPAVRGNDLPPFVVKEWLDKPDRLIRAVLWTPEGGAQWLGKEFRAVADEMRPAEQRAFVSDERRFGMAEYELACGNDVVWGFWLGERTFLTLAVVGTTSAGCFHVDA